MNKLITAFGLVAILASCGGEQPQPVTPPPNPTTSADAAAATNDLPEAAAPVTAWKDMNGDQKKTVMQNDVLPKMKAEFQALDGKKYADFSCVTCHGQDAKNGKFQMPNPTLPKLTLGDPNKPFAKHDPKMVKFMIEKVEHGVADALKVSPYDPKTQSGFGCMNCHTMAK